MKYVANNKEYDTNSSINQDIKRKFVEREVITCVSSLVEMLMSNNIEGFSIDDVINNYIDNSEEIEEIKEQLETLEIIQSDFEEFEEHDITDFKNDLLELDLNDILNDIEVIFNLQAKFEEFENEELETKITDLKEKIKKSISDAVEELENKITDLESEQENPQEPLEWWEITDWFFEKLDAKKEPLIDNGYGKYWGRTTSGQAILLDSVIDEIMLENMNVFQGQESSWYEEPVIPEVPNNNGYAVIDFTQFSHENDKHLYRVLAYNSSKEEYVVWIYNKLNDCFNNGHYFNEKGKAYYDYGHSIDD